MTKTVKEHFEDCKSVSNVIDNANALLTKTQHELQSARDVLEGIKPYLHPLHVVSNYTVKRICDREKATPAEFVDGEIARINALLGDRV